MIVANAYKHIEMSVCRVKMKDSEYGVDNGREKYIEEVIRHMKIFYPIGRR